MIETITALVTFMTFVQAFNVDQYSGRSYAFTVKSTITDAQLLQAKAPDSHFLVDATGKIFRINNYVFLIKD